SIKRRSLPRLRHRQPVRLGWKRRHRPQRRSASRLSRMKGISRMKRIAVVLCAALAASALIAATPATVPVPDKGPNNGWIVTTSKQHEHLLLLKVRAEVPADVQPAKYPNAVEMHWKYAPD